jgi:transglutaminase-like putative cysteine protease
MNRYRLAHVTAFNYDGVVSDSYNVVRLRPRDDQWQSCLSFKLQTTPESRASSYLDNWGNWIHSFNVLGEHKSLRIETHSVVHVEAPPSIPDGGISLQDVDAMRDELDDEFDLLAPTGYVPHPPALQDLIQRAERASSGTLAGFALATAALVHQRFRYEKGATHVQSTVLDALGSGAGVCQDFAHIMLAMVRMRGIPGRYVSGYLVPQSATGGEASAEDVIGGQASHAWMEMLMPGFGWIGLDPTMGQPVGPRHIRVAHGRDYGDAAPVRGVYKGHAGQQLFVDVGVRPALDDDGQERLEETAAAPHDQTLIEAAPEQQQQQQQQ